MRTAMIVVLIGLLLPLAAFARDKKLIGGPCTYEEFGGYCTATGKDASGKNLFAFIGAVRDRDVDLADNAMMEGMSMRKTSMPCKLEFIIQGSCTPCVFSIGECGKAAWDLFQAMTTKKKRR